MRRLAAAFRLACLVLLGLGVAAPRTPAAPVAFDIPAQPLDEALLAFARQAGVEVLFSFEDVGRQRTRSLAGSLEPAEAIARLLAGTGLAASANATGGLVITRAPVSASETGTLKGRIVGTDGGGIRGARILLPASRKTGYTDDRGYFSISGVPAGPLRVVVTASGHQLLEMPGAALSAGETLTLPPQTLRAEGEPSRLAPFLVAGRAEEARPFARSRDALPPRTATGNIDLPRTENDALPFTIHDREQIRRSGAVNLNEFLQRELLDGDASKRSPEQDENDGPAYIASGGNLALRGYADQETVILVNGRRMPEIVASAGMQTSLPDVNLIPLSLVQQIEVLPISASALYSGNPVGGVINIVLRPDADANVTELTTTYTNTLDGYDAPQSMASMLHSRSLLGGALHLRLNASFTASLPPTESELGHRGRWVLTEPPPPLWNPVYRATPNLRTPDPRPENRRTPKSPPPALAPLFGPGSSPVSSVAPGADGKGGLAAFAGREGVRSLGLFDGPGGMASSVASADFPFGRKQHRAAFFASAGYEVTPWLEVGLDGTFARTSIHRGHTVIAGNLQLEAGSPHNPFGQEVEVALNETAPLLGEDYSEARLEFASGVFGALIRLPRGWRVSGDVQYARNVTKYRGLLGADPERWQELVDAGVYNPLRDTQVFAPPREFYDRVLVFRARRDEFATLGDYNTVDAAIRATNETLALPTGRGIVNFGGDYRRNHLQAYYEQPHFGDGSPAGEPLEWTARTIQRYSAFAELQASLLPDRLRPSWLRAAEADVALRYVAANTAREDYLSPTLGLKFELPGGLIARGSFTSSNRFPAPQMSRPVLRPGQGGVGGLDATTIYDPLRDEVYETATDLDHSPSLATESAITQTLGLVLQRGKVHRLRAALDYVDTRKTNELLAITAQSALDLEPYLPGRVFRDPVSPDDPDPAGRVNFILEGSANLGRRSSRNWNVSLDYVWREAFGGSLALYSRLVYYERYRRQIVPAAEFVNELRHPQFGDISLLRYRSNFGASWSTPDVGFGLDGHYFHSRVLPRHQWAGQGHDRIRPLWQFDSFVQGNLDRWLPWRSTRFGLTGQLRVNNVFNAGYPKYVYAPAGVQSYGDWRGRVFSFSLTATF